MLDHKLPALFDKKIVRLKTRFHPETRRFQVNVRGRWRQNSEFEYFCFKCCYESQQGVAEYLQSDYKPLEYYGYLDDDKVWVYWGCCITHGRRITDFYWAGKPRQQKPRGGNEHGWLGRRRQLSRY